MCLGLLVAGTAVLMIVGTVPVSATTTDYDYDAPRTWTDIANNDARRLAQQCFRESVASPPVQSRPSIGALE